MFPRLETAGNPVVFFLLLWMGLQGPSDGYRIEVILIGERHVSMGEFHKALGNI